MSHQHDWELTYRDGPLDMNDWRCRSCGELRQKRGRVDDKPPSDDQASPTPNDQRSWLSMLMWYGRRKLVQWLG